MKKIREQLRFRCLTEWGSDYGFHLDYLHCPRAQTDYSFRRLFYFEVILVTESSGYLYNFSWKKIYKV